MQVRHALIVVLEAMTLAVVSAGVLYAAAESHSAFAQNLETPFADIDSYVSRVMGEERIPGVAVVVVQGSRISYLRGFGTVSLRNPSPVSPQTVFDLASCSKSFTALAVLLLHEQGLVELDNPATDYLPDFHLADRETSSQVTVRHLLNHASGLPGRFAEPLAFHSGSDAMDKLVSSMAKIHLNRPAGASFDYSDLNYALLGAIIEKVTGVPFEDYLHEQVFTPLELTSTTLYPGEAAAMERADGHQLSFGHVITRNTPVYRSAAPAGWVMSSAEDLGRWLILNLNGGRLDGRQAVPVSLIQLMQTPGVTFMQNGFEVGYGMGWFTGTLANRQPVVWHSGDTANFATDMVLLPGLGLGVAVLVNSQNSSRVHEVAPGIVGILMERPFELPAAPWLASWQAADIVAIGSAALSAVLLLLLPVYAWSRWRRWHRRADREMPPTSASKTLRVWRMVLPLTPLALLTTTLAAAASVFWVLFGINVFRTLVRFGAFAPPGVWISGWLLLSAISSWALILAVRAVVTTHGTRATRSENGSQSDTT